MSGKNSASVGPWKPPDSSGPSANGANGSPPASAGREERYEVKEFRAFS